MAIRQDKSIPITLQGMDDFLDRVDIRNYLLMQWINEKPSSKYRYFVETLVNGDRIYLERPGRLNKGCDFVIYIENRLVYGNGNDRPPKHEFLLEDIENKKMHLNLQDYKEFLNAIEAIYNCKSYSISALCTKNLPVIGESYELILKTLRWFFIEQDITYWLNSGRQMLFNVIKNI